MGPSSDGLTALRVVCTRAALLGAFVGFVDAMVLFAARRAHPPALLEGALLVLSCGGLVAIMATLLALAAYGLRALVQGLPEAAKSVAVAIFGALGGGVLGVALFSGSGVRRLGVRPWGIAATVLFTTFVAWGLWRRRARLLAWLRTRHGAGLLAALSVGLYTLHTTVFVRQYALLHLLAALASLGGVLLAGACLSVRSRMVAVGLALAGAFAVGETARSHALRALLRQSAPLARYAVVLVGALRGGDPVLAARVRPPIAGPHLPLHGNDIVLVTIDALRADRLRALGGRGRVPTLDAMAERGVLFRRVYCATPHTSYSLASLMLGTHARSVLALPGASGPRATLATWLGEAGYATAAFFPPAVFAVDGARFGALRTQRFGFATVSEGYAPARERVQEVDRWLGGVSEHQRVFVWVHFFEPHEPYEAHPEHPYGSDREARYDAECSAADDGVAALRAVFVRHGRRAVWVVTADHGEEFGEHGGSFHGTTLYEEQVRVPLLLEGPGLAPAVVDEAVSLVDLVPTLLGGVGLHRPAGVRGNNLGALLLGGERDTRAFAATGTLRMVATARDKLIVDLADNTLERYDLLRDPRELRNLADDDPARTYALRAEVSGWEASHATIEAERSPQETVSMPTVLLRAEQGDVSVAREVAMLLGAGGFPVRRRAARVLGDLGVGGATSDALARELTTQDPVLVREAAVSLALLGDRRGLSETRRAHEALARTPDDPSALRAAVALARLGDRAGVRTLAHWVRRGDAEEALRDRAVASLEALRDPDALEAWVALLHDARLAPRAAAALAALGDARAIEPLRGVLSTVRYPLTLRAIVDALLSLGAPDATERVVDALVALDPLPEVFPLLARIHEPGTRVAGVAVPVRVGPRPVTCWLRGGTSPRVRRIYVELTAEADGVLTLLPGVTASFRAGTHELAVDLQRPLLRPRLRLSATTPITVTRIAAR
jgi:arylsulfatase A-like enzyme